MRTKLKRILSAALACVMALALLPASALAVGNSAPEGTVTATKDLMRDEQGNPVVDENGYYTLKLSVAGIPYTEEVATGADVVLVVDTSGSMSTAVKTRVCGSTSFARHGWGLGPYYYECKECNKEYWYKPKSCTNEVPVKTRMDVAIDAAQEFVDQLLPSGTLNKLAVIGFAGNNESGGANDNTAIKVATSLTSSADTLKAQIGTMKAEGATNYSAALQKAYTILNDRGQNDKASRPAYVIFISDGAPGWYGNSAGNTNWNGTEQAADLEGAGVTIYAIGIEMSGNASALTAISSQDKAGNELYQNVTDGDMETQLPNILKDLANQINKTPAGKNAVLTDVVDTSKFDIDTYSIDTYSDDLALAEDGKTLTWTIGDIPEEEQTVTIKVKAKDGIYGTDIPTNTNVYLNYTNPKDNSSVTIPESQIGRPTVTILDTRPRYTVTYTDGVPDEVVFADQTTSNLLAGDKTPAFSGTPTRTGYNFDGWSPEVAEEVAAPASGNTITYVAQWTKRNDLSYTINYYQDSIEDANKIGSTTVNNVTFGTQVTIAAGTVEGQLDWKLPTGYASGVQQGTVPYVVGVGDNTINVLYTKRNDLSYTINYYKDSIEDANKIGSTTVNNVTFGTQVTIAAGTVEGQLDWKLPTGYASGVQQGTVPYVVGVGDNTINVLYTKRADLSYTVNYLEKDTNKVLATAKTVGNQTVGTVIKASDEVISIDGYVYVNADKATLTIGTGENVINLYYVGKNTSVDVRKVVTSVTNPAEKPYDTTETAKVGDTITWTITVTNNGNVSQTLTLADTLSNNQAVKIQDASKSDVTGNITIAANTTSIYTATYTVQIGDSGDTLVNTAILKDGDTPKDEDTAPGVKIDPAVTVDKTVDKTTASVGDKLTYTITVTNNANITLENIVVTDEMLGMTGNNVVTIASLDAGKAWTQDYTYTVQSSDAGKTLVNTAIASIGEQELGKDSSDGTNIRKPYIPPVKPSKPVLNTEDHVAYIIGYEDGTVKPNNNITRAEVATIFFRLLSDDSRAEFWSQTNSYSDVALTNWFNNAVSTLSNAGVITGYPDDTFKPNASITRAEFAAIAARFSDAEATSTCSFTDVPADHWAASSIALAEELGWITGYEDGTFHPDQAITRAEAMTLINRVLERAVDEDHMLSDMVTWTDNQPSDWFYEAVQEATNSHEYTRTTTKVPNQSFCYENWVKIIEAPDWAALENAWSTANSQ